MNRLVNPGGRSGARAIEPGPFRVAALAGCAAVAVTPPNPSPGALALAARTTLRRVIPALATSSECWLAGSFGASDVMTIPFTGGPASRSRTVRARRARDSLAPYPGLRRGANGGCVTSGSSA